MHTWTFILLTALCALLGFTTSMRLGWVMSTKVWFTKLDKEAKSCRAWTIWLTGLLSALLMAVLCIFIMSQHGLFWGLMLTIGTIPLVGLLWLLIFGTNKVVERVIAGVDAKLSQLQ